MQRCHTRRVSVDGPVKPGHDGCVADGVCADSTSSNGRGRCSGDNNAGAPGCGLRRSMMKLCRFDEDRLGVVIGDQVHDVTEAQTQIRAAARYDMKGDAVIAALPTWRKRIEDMAAKAPGKPVASVKLISPIARPSKAMAAPTNYRKHIAEMRTRTDLPPEATN